MRPRTEIEQDGRVKLDLVIEVLLDIRTILLNQTKEKKVKKQPGRPKRIK